MTPDLFIVPEQRSHSTLGPSSTKRSKRIAFNVTEGEDIRTITPAGRDAWALGELISAGADGCTPITHVGPRWSHLRRATAHCVRPRHRKRRGTAWRRVCRQARSIRPALARCLRRSCGRFQAWG